MTGETLYARWQWAMHAQGVDTRRWESVPTAEQRAWETFAAELRGPR